MRSFKEEKENAMANSKDVVVTGVSTGIGWGTTKVLISNGFRVFGSVRKQADADRLQSEFGNGFVPLLMDITDADAVHRAAQKVGSMIGDRNLVGLVNNAGVVVSGPLLYLRPSEYRRQLEVNMISPLVVIQAFAPLLGTDKKRQGPTGRIVNISSSGAKVAIPLIGAYSSSKAGLEGMSDALRQELMLFGIDGDVRQGRERRSERVQADRVLGGGAELPEVHRHRSTYERLTPGASGRGRPRGAHHGETEGALCGHSATVQELDSAQTSSYEDARRLPRKADGTHKGNLRTSPFMNSTNSTNWILITGTSTGIGRAATFTLAENGYRVLAAVRKQEDIESLLAEAGTRRVVGFVEPIILDVTNAGQIAAAVELVSVKIASGGRLHAIVNNAGAQWAGPIETMPLTEWRYQFDVTFFGPIALTQQLLPQLRASRGRVINVTSIGGIMPVR
jgi:NAD(P)-dependent dehydrogenase (short-subunit alcohol dehydrogenase family)